MGLSQPLSGLTGSNRWKPDSKTEKVTSLSPGRGTLSTYGDEKISSAIKRCVCL